MKTYLLPNGVKMVVERARLHGLCDHESGIVTIDTKQGAKDTLGTIIHETVHRARPDLEEHEVEALEAALVTVLWGEGYRVKQKIRKKR